MILPDATLHLALRAPKVFFVKMSAQLFAVGLVLVLWPMSPTALHAQISPNPHSDFFATDTIQELRITFGRADWRQVLDSLAVVGQGVLEGTVETKGFKFLRAGVRYLSTPGYRPGEQRNGFEIVLNHGFSVANLQGCRTLRLTPALRDPSMVRQVLGYEIARQYMPAPRANYVKVFVDGDYYGLLVNEEPIEERPFREKYFGTVQAGLFRPYPVQDKALPAGCRKGIFGNLEFEPSLACYTYNFAAEPGSNFEDLQELTRVLATDSLALATWLDVDRTLWMLAFENLFLNLNGYTGRGSHYALVQDASGRFAPVLQDLNLCFGSYKNTGRRSDLSLRKLPALPPLLHADNPLKPLISRLLSDPFWRKVYFSHYQALYNDWIRTGRYAERARQLQTLIRDDLSKDPNWPYSMEEFDQSLERTIGRRSKIPGIVSLMEQRREFLKTVPELQVLPPTFDSIAVAHRDSAAERPLTEYRIRCHIGNFPQTAWIVYRFDGDEDWYTTQLLDDGQHFDGEAGDGIFGVVITPATVKGHLEYYFMASNAGMVGYFPPDYIHQPLRTSLLQINQ